MATFDLNAAHKHSSRHRDEIARSEVVGCFYCMETFSPADISEWIDGPGGAATALCPKCGIDSVIGSASGLPARDPTFLNEMNLHWFGSVDESLWDADGNGIKPDGMQ